MSPRIALVATVIVTFVVYATLAHAADVPRFFMDELYYMRAGVSAADGEGLAFRGERWGYGPLYPLLLAALVRLTSDQETTYELAKLANALFFALAAVPIYLLSRRLLPPWPSVAVAALAAAIPSSMYVSVVMTESAAYASACVALYAVFLTLERPTWWRQVAAVGATLAAAALRPQLVSLYAGYLVALGLLVALSPSRRARLRASPWALWPTALSVLVALAWVARPVLRGDSPTESLGSYRVLAEWYDPLEVARWFAFNLGDLALYLAVVPVVVAPVVLTRCWSRARAGSDRDAAFLALFAAMNVVGLALVGAFSSTEIGLGIVHDRYLFYLVPLWLLVLVHWLHEGLPRPRRPLAVGAAAAVALVAVLPYGEIAGASSFRQFEAVATEIWGQVGAVAAKVPVVDARLVGIGFAVLVVALVAVLPRRWSLLVPGFVVLVFLANAAPAWRSAFVEPLLGATPAGTRSWVDDALPDGARATILYVERPCNREVEDGSELLTEFFNRSVDRAVTIGGSGRGNRPQLHVERSGALRFVGGEPFVARFVVTQPGVELVGRRLAGGMTPRLVLWQTDGPVHAATARSDDGLRGSCEG